MFVPGGNGVGGGGDGDGGGATTADPGEDTPVRPPQSTQSLPTAHVEYSEPEPPSSQSPSDAFGQSLPHCSPAGSGGIRGRGGGGDAPPAEPELS
eukprot:4282878-Prymnesium_polylepis.1